MSFKKILRRVSKKLSSSSVRSPPSRSDSLSSPVTQNGSIDAETGLSGLSIMGAPLSSEPVQGIERPAEDASSQSGPGVAQLQETGLRAVVEDKAEDGILDGDFPLELVEAILDFLLNDRQSLKLCALVCQKWLLSIRKRLFRSMTLGHSTDYAGLVKILEGSPVIADCVRDLNIRGDIGPCAWMAGLGGVSTNLVYVQSLTITTMAFHILRPETFTALSRSISHVMGSITHLSIQHVMFQHQAQLQQFVSSFERLTSVSLLGSGYTTAENTMSHLTQLLPARMGRPKVVSLELVDCYSEVYRTFLQGTVLELRHLTLHSAAAPQDAKLLRSAAESTGENMELENMESLKNKETLEIMEALEIMESFTSTESQKIMKSLRNIESLNLKLDPVFEDLYPVLSELKALKRFVVEISVEQKPAYQIAWLDKAINNLSPTVSQIQFRMSGDVRHFEAADWNVIDAAIEFRLKNLERVEVEFSLFGKAVVATEQLLKEKLEKLRLSKHELLDCWFSYKPSVVDT